MGSFPPRGSARSSQMVLVPCLGIRGWGWRRRAEGLKQEERTSLHRIMRWDVKKNSWMLHAPTIDFRITMYIPYSEQRGQCPSTGNIENPPLPDFLLPCTNEVQLNRFWKPINNRSWGGGGGWRGAACLYYLQEYFGCLWFSVVSFTATTYLYLVVNFLSQVIFVFLLLLGIVLYANKVETKEI